MDAIRRMLRTLRADESGATAIEYGLIVALIAVTALAGFAAMGGGSTGMWTKISADVDAVM